MIKHRGFIFWLCFIMAAVVLAGCASRAVTPLPITPTKAETETSVPTASPTITATRTPKPTSTITPMPTIEPTRDPNATNTPMVPTPVSNQGYRLTEWTPEKAETLIQYLKNYPETLPYWMQGYMGSGYYGSFKAAGLAELESSLRFPEFEQANNWQWDGAFNQYQAYNEDAANLYASFIKDALNSNETDLANFEQWAGKNIALSLTTHEVSPPHGYQNSTVLHFYPGGNAGYSGGFTIWLVQKEGKFSAYPLPNIPMVAYGDGDSEVRVVDITGDGIAEAFVQNVDYGSFGAHSGNLTIYRLDQVPPRAIVIDPQIPNPDITQWSVSDEQANPITTFSMPPATGSDTPCNSFEMSWQFKWQQDRLKFNQLILPTAKEMEQDPFCTRVLANTLGSYLEEPSILVIYKQLLSLPYIDLQYEEAPRFGGYPFDVEAHRLGLALYLSSQGDEAGANEQIELIRASKNLEKKAWRENALAYYAVHKDRQKLYQFCLSSQTCQSFLYQDKLIALIPTSQFDEAPDIMRQMGFEFVNSGSYDFDHDGQAEIWLLFDNTDECGKILILAQTSSGIKSRWEGFQCSSEPDGVGYEKVIKEIYIEPKESIYGLPVYQIMVEGQDLLDEPILYWSPDGEKPTVYPGEIGEMIDLVQNRLLLGDISLLQAQDQLFTIQNLPVDPFHTSFWASERQAQILYLLGLTYELNGQTQQAIEAYLDLWRNYPDSSYAYMAWAKLEPEN